MIHSWTIKFVSICFAFILALTINITSQAKVDQLFLANTDLVDSCGQENCEDPTTSGSSVEVIEEEYTTNNNLFNVSVPHCDTRPSYPCHINLVSQRDPADFLKPPSQ